MSNIEELELRLSCLKVEAQIGGIVNKEESRILCETCGCYCNLRMCRENTIEYSNWKRRINQMNSCLIDIINKNSNNFLERRINQMNSLIDIIKFKNNYWLKKVINHNLLMERILNKKYPKKK